MWSVHKAEVKLKKIRQRLQGTQEQSTAQIRLLTTVETKLTVAIVAAKDEAPAESKPYNDLLTAFGKLDSAGRRAIVKYLNTQT